MTSSHASCSDRVGWPRIAIIGSYPPPYGGIGVHLERLARRLEAEGVDFVLYNTVSESERPPHVVSVARRKHSWYLDFCLRHRCDVVHLVTVNWLSRVLMGLTAWLRRGTYILSIHGKSISDALNESGRLQSILTRWLLRRMNVVVACNPQIQQECINRAGLPAKWVRMVPAFIPPLSGRAEGLPQEIRLYLRSHEPVLSAVGWIGKAHAGQDMYGIDLLIALVTRLAKSYPRVGLVLSVNGGPPEQIRETIETARREVGDHMLLLAEALEDISSVLAASQLFLRTTNTDGDAVSIREALYLGVPVVASDAVTRPRSCVLFRSRDIEDLERQVRSALGNLAGLKAGIAPEDVVDNAVPILELYDELLGSFQ